MSKSKEELEGLKKEYEELNEKCRELTMEDLEQVTGGRVPDVVFDLPGIETPGFENPFKEAPQPFPSV